MFENKKIQVNVPTFTLQTCVTVVLMWILWEIVHLLFHPNHNRPVLCRRKRWKTEQYLAVVFLVFPGQGNVHGIRHDVDRGLVAVPAFSVGFLGEQLRY